MVRVVGAATPPRGSLASNLRTCSPRMSLAAGTYSYFEEPVLASACDPALVAGSVVTDSETTRGKHLIAVPADHALLDAVRDGNLDRGSDGRQVCGVELPSCSGR